MKVVFESIRLFSLLMFLFLHFILYDYGVKIATEVNGNDLLGGVISYMEFAFIGPLNPRNADPRGCKVI